MKLRYAVLAAVLTMLPVLAVTACTSSDAETSPDHGSAQPSELVNKPVSQFSGFGLDPAQPRPNFLLQDASGRLVNFVVK